MKLHLPGFVTESIPQYPTDGWKNVTAYPDGTLYYQGKQYTELYYESAVKMVATEPTQGYVVPVSRASVVLAKISDSFGLKNNEKQELIQYWMDRLMRLNSPYVFISYFSPEDKQKIDGVEINPKPDTMIEFILYFKALKENKAVTAPVLPTPKARIGFTAVEWGGIVDY